MLRTVLFLLISLIVVPLLIFYYDSPPAGMQWELIRVLLQIYIGASATCFLISTITKNYSQVDKLWSLMPIVYSWVVAVRTGFDPRVLLMAILVTVWGLRLSYNFYRRGGYTWPIWRGEEDYRWTVLRRRPAFQNRWIWMIFNLLFISFYQMGLILLFTLPIVKSAGGSTLQFSDFILAFLMLMFILIETIADQQQWNFQSKKYQLMDAGQLQGTVYEKGFLDKGLWRWARHPNYAMEQSIWVVFYLFTISSGAGWINWSVAGVILLFILFKSSSDFSEAISEEKYPGYKAYQNRVGRFFPKVFGK